MTVMSETLKKRNPISLMVVCKFSANFKSRGNPDGNS